MVKLRRLVILPLMLLAIVPAYARQPGIRGVNFRDFSYPFHPAPGHEVFGELGEVVKVRGGVSYAGRVGQSVGFLYFRVAEVLYGDMTGDGRDEAAVVAIYGSNSGTFYLTEIYLYGMEGGRAVLLSTLGEGQVSKDYQEYYGGEGRQIFEAIEGGREIADGLLTVRHLADGAHCCPQRVATLRYKLEGGGLVLSGEPSNRPSEERDRKMAAFYEPRI